MNAAARDHERLVGPVSAYRVRVATHDEVADVPGGVASLCRKDRAAGYLHGAGRNGISRIAGTNARRARAASGGDVAATNRDVAAIVLLAAADARRLLAALRDDCAAFYDDLARRRKTARRADARRVLAAEDGEAAVALDSQDGIGRDLDARRILPARGENVVTVERNRAGCVGDHKR